MIGSLSRMVLMRLPGDLITPTFKRRCPGVFTSHDFKVDLCNDIQTEYRLFLLLESICQHIPLGTFQFPGVLVSCETNVRSRMALTNANAFC